MLYSVSLGVIKSRTIQSVKYIVTKLTFKKIPITSIKECKTKPLQYLFYTL